ncbi:MAG: PmoA family protein [Saprospiraceae bacterium]|nr:PmoA family protein [Saprospiraceae bacterium]
MKKRRLITKIVGCCICGLLAIWTNGQTSMVELAHDSSNQSIKVTINGDHFTSYLYSDAMEKPVLFPIYSRTQRMMTRGYPMVPIPNERTDHPHHLGLWLNYGDVNGLDFWNNSSAIPPEKKSKYGVIKHASIVAQEERGQQASFKVRKYWNDPSEAHLLQEETTYAFSTIGEVWVIDRTTTLRALVDVGFSDNKEGMLGIRVARLLEFPADKPLTLTDELGRARSNKVVNNDGVMGHYLSSTGEVGGDVWGTRASWMKLYAPIEEGKEAAFVIIDHPENVGYPTYWHARTYGLFAANPLGQKVFSKGKKELNFALNRGEEVTFKYRVLVADGDALDPKQINTIAEDFSK